MTSSVLDAARRLAAGPCPTYWDWAETGVNERGWPQGGNVLKCAHCRQGLHEHAPDCPVLQMPKIVAALEAGEKRERLYREFIEYVATPGQSIDYGRLPELVDKLILKAQEVLTEGEIITILAES